MRNNKNLNIPVTILHVMDDVQYKIGGKLLSINENADTCTIKFTNGRIEKGIPMSDIYINEGFIDAIKSIGHKIKNVFQTLIKKVKGYVAFCENGVLDKYSFFNSTNIAILQSRGELPEGVTFYSTDNDIEIARQNGINIKRPDLNAAIDSTFDKYERGMIETYWRRVMNVAGTTDKTVDESINYVNKTFYNKYRLNEDAVPTLEPQQNSKSGQFYDGPICDANRLYHEVKAAVLSQTDYVKIKQKNTEIKDLLHTIKDINNDIKTENNEENLKALKEELANAEKNLEALKQKKLEIYTDSPNPGEVPLIFGAPGIGKTMIVKQIVNGFKNDKSNPIKLGLEYVDCTGMNQDRVVIPVPVKETLKKYGVQGLDEVQLSWLPGYSKDISKLGTKECMKHELRFARCLHKSTNEEEYERIYNNNFNLDEFLEDTTYWSPQNGDYQGGVLFLDEMLRAESFAVGLFMQICTKTVGSLRLPKSWAIVAASNRQIDFTDESSDAAFEQLEQPAIMARFRIMHFRPKKKDWIKWARELNSDGLPNVLPMLVDYIEATPGDAVFYATADNGGYDREAAIAHFNLKDLRIHPNEKIGGGFDADKLKTGINRKAIFGGAGEKSIARGIYKKVTPRSHENATRHFYNSLDLFLNTLSELGIKAEYISSSGKKRKRPWSLTDFIRENKTGDGYVLNTKRLSKLFYGSEKQNNIPENKFKELYTTATGGKEYPFPGYNESYIEQAIEEIFYAWLEKDWNFQEDSRDGDNEITDLRKFYDYKKDFSYNDILSIYRTGCFTDEDKLFKDNMEPNAAQKETPKGHVKVSASEWKSNTQATDMAYQYILSNYPAQRSQKDFEDMIKLIHGLADFVINNESMRSQQSKNIFDSMLNSLCLDYSKDKTKSFKLSKFGVLFRNYCNNGYKEPTVKEKEPTNNLQNSGNNIIIDVNNGITLKKSQELENRFNEITSMTYNVNNIEANTEKLVFFKGDKVDYRVKAVICFMYDNCLFYRNIVNFAKYMAKTKEISKQGALIGKFSTNHGDGENSFLQYICKYAKVNIKTEVYDENTNKKITYNDIKKGIDNIKNSDNKNNGAFLGCVDPFRMCECIIDASYNNETATLIGKKTK